MNKYNNISSIDLKKHEFKDAPELILWYKSIRNKATILDKGIPVILWKDVHRARVIYGNIRLQSVKETTHTTFFTRLVCEINK